MTSGEFDSVARVVAELGDNHGAGSKPSAVAGVSVRPRVAGKFLWIGEEKFWIRGVTYGTLKPGADGVDYPGEATLERDFALMRASGVNTVRCYTVPPRRLLDAAARRGLKVIIGLPWEQHVAFLDDPARADDIVARVAAGVRS
jgi:hypothetical protein